MARITIPYAVTDFADLRERGFYYVDKTNYIPGLEDYNAPVFLRPRRFGKSLLFRRMFANPSTAEEFFKTIRLCTVVVVSRLEMSRLFPKRRGRRKTGAL